VYSDWIGSELNLTIYTFGVAFTLFALDKWVTEYLVFSSAYSVQTEEYKDPFDQHYQVNLSWL
jgi:hypothetical protein